MDDDGLYIISDKAEECLNGLDAQIDVSQILLDLVKGNKPKEIRVNNIIKSINKVNKQLNTAIKTEAESGTEPEPKN